MDVLSGGGGGCCGPMVWDLSHRHSIANRSCSNARGEVNLAGFTAVYLDDQGGASVDVESPQARVVC